MKSTAQNTWLSRYGITAAVLIIITVTVNYNKTLRRQEHCLPGIYHVTLVLTKVEPQTRPNSDPST